LAEEVQQYEDLRLGKMMPLITVGEGADSLSSDTSHDFLPRGVYNKDQTKKKKKESIPFCSKKVRIRNILFAEMQNIFSHTHFFPRHKTSAEISP
jgi:hypothetical protein